MEQAECILVVDDDTEIRSMVRMVLEKAGFHVITAVNGLEAVNRVREDALDLVLMDVSMPVMDGFKACRQIRLFSDIPVVFLTIQAEEEALVNGFEAGAFDYIEKPFRAKELIARIRSILQRSPRRPNLRVERLTYENLTLDLKTREVFCDGELLPMTRMGYQLLEYFLLHVGEVVGKADLLRDVWASQLDMEGSDNMVEAAIKRLRKDMHDDSRNPHYLKTIWGMGYRFGEKLP
jgi:DNA-binding response OmpR family regulator